MVRQKVTAPWDPRRESIELLHFFEPGAIISSYGPHNGSFLRCGIARSAAATPSSRRTPAPIDSSAHPTSPAPAHDRHPRHRFRPRQRAAGARHGRGRGGEVRPPRHADGDGRDRRRAVAPPPVAQPRESALGRPRPLRAVQRPRLDAALRAAAPHRLRPAAGRAQALPPAGLEDAGASGDRPHAGRRDDDRSARSGHRQRRGHGPRRSAARGAVQPAGPRASSTTAPARSSATAA